MSSHQAKVLITTHIKGIPHILEFYPSFILFPTPQIPSQHDYKDSYWLVQLHSIFRHKDQS